MDFFNSDDYIWRRYLPKISKISDNKLSQTIWDIPFTIRQLSYLTHSHFRYYGKFPSVVAGQIIDNYYPKNSNRPILDNFSGSGTTMVESALRGKTCTGVDVSWLSVLASNVKVTNVDLEKIRSMLHQIQHNYVPFDDYIPTTKEEKWFELEVLKGLKAIQHHLLQFETSDELKFLIVAFLAIIRRTSRAFDAEVRPHINKDKKTREPLKAYVKKVQEMLINQRDFQSVPSVSYDQKCILGDAVNLSKYYDGEAPALVVSHPPYLNAFNYAPVFSLEYMWGEPFENCLSFVGGFQKNEIIAHPANEKNTQNYFEFLTAAYSETYNLQKSGDVLAIVIGDCTRNKKLIPVIDTIIRKATEIGYTPHEINYRTTHYGTGKYAYENRADYHTNSEAKKDGILVFKK